jgi:hypoxanthine phosphoribosyltransferase
MATKCAQDISDPSEWGIVAISRGGLMPAQVVAYRTGITMVRTVCAQSYQGAEQGSVRLSSGHPFTPFGICPDKILIIDDLVDTGNTLAAVHHFVTTGCRNTPHVVTAVAILKEHNRRTYDPTVFGKQLPDAWIHFPYER